MIDLKQLTFTQHKSDVKNWAIKALRRFYLAESDLDDYAQEADAL